MAEVEGIQSAPVTQWLQQRVADLAPPLRFELIAGGHSNLTYRVIDTAGTNFVLRRPPLGHVLESAHDMGREHKIIAALADWPVPVAPVVGLCSDAEVNGAPFYVMKFVDGPVLHDADAAKVIDEAKRHDLGLNVIDVLAQLHLLNPDEVGLGDLGRKEAYLDRQLKRWTKQWLASKTHEIPEMEELEKILPDRKPEQVGATIVHGDYRLGNMIVDGEKILAVLDWELCTLGDPLADVGYLLNTWAPPGEAEPDTAATAVGGFPPRDVLCERYVAATARDLSQINYYRAFAHWRLACIAQGVYKRYLVGAMGENHGLDLDAYKARITTLARQAMELL